MTVLEVKTFSVSPAGAETKNCYHISTAVNLSKRGDQKQEARARECLIVIADCVDIRLARAENDPLSVLCYRQQQMDRLKRAAAASS